MYHFSHFDSTFIINETGSDFSPVYLENGSESIDPFAMLRGWELLKLGIKINKFLFSAFSFVVSQKMATFAAD